MKTNVLLVMLLIASATGSLMSMEQGKKGRLNFRLDTFLTIKAYSKQNMDFAVPPSEFLGKCILDVIPLDEKDSRAIKLGFANAIHEQKTVKVPYTLEQTKFLATITALETKNHPVYNYFVKVTEAGNDNQ